MSKFFQGEMMNCVVCGRSERSNRNVESGWRCLEVDEFHFYVCPFELPADGDPASAYKVAYQEVIACCLNQLIINDGGNPDPEVERYRQSRREAYNKSINF